MERLRILHVEDNPADARLLREALAEMSDVPYEMLHTRRLLTGLECLAEAAFDVIILDLGLPDAEGLRVIERVRSQAAAVPIIVVTGRNDPQIAEHARAVGAIEYLIKGEGEHALIRAALRRLAHGTD